MPKASYLQTSFLGGRWSPYYQGRADDPRYRTALAECYNSYPLEEGCWTRRPGTRYMAPTRFGAYAVVRKFSFSQATPYTMEFTPGHLRLFSGPGLVTTAVQSLVNSISSASPAVVNTTTPHGLSTGDEVVFAAPNNDVDRYTQGLFNRQFSVTVVDTYNFSLSDCVTGAAFNGSTVTLGAHQFLAQQVLDFATPYTLADLKLGIQVVQSIEGLLNQVVVLNANHPPYKLTLLTAAGSNYAATFSFAAITFLDGPYLNFINDGSQVTPSATSGVITLSIGYTAWSSSTTYAAGVNVLYSGTSYTSLQDNNLNQTPNTSTSYWQANTAPTSINNGLGFLSTDVGRSIRLFSEPLAWTSSTAYVVGNLVKYNGSYWQALVGNTNVPPDTNATDWSIITTAAAWTWGRITVVNSSANITVQLVGGNLLYTNVINTWQLGVYTATNSTYPACGCYHEGRLWLAGAIPNRFDASTTDDIFTFTPTGPDGTLADNNGISETLNSSDVNTIYWMIGNQTGVVCGTQAGEWLVQASALNDPLTPTSIQAHRVTKFGCANIQPVETPLSIVFVPRYARKTIEYIADVYSGKFSGTNIAITAKDLTVAGIAEVAYTQELTPVLWFRMADGSLAGCTYKRESPFGTQPASFSAWHKHALGTGRTVTSIVGGPSQGGNLDTLVMVTYSASTGYYQVELLTDLFDENTPITNAWFVDGATPPVSAYYDTTVNPNVVRLGGYEYLAGQSVDVWGGGLDLGTYTVSATGEVDVPVNVSGSLFNSTYLANLTAQGNVFGFQGLSVTQLQNTPVAPVTATIQAFSASSVGAVNYPVYVNWANNAVYQVAGSGPGGWYRSVLSTGGLSVAAAGTTVYTGGLAGSPVLPGVPANDGYYYCPQTVSNYPAISKLNANSFAFVGQIGTNSAFSGIPYPQQLVPITLGAVNYLIDFPLYSLGAVQGQVWAINLNTQASIGSLATLQGSSTIGCAGPSYYANNQATASVYAASFDNPSVASSGTYGNIYLNRVWLAQSQAGVTTSGYKLLATLAPSQFGPAWAAFTSNPADGLVLDQTDGNVIMHVNLQGGIPWNNGTNYTTGQYVYYSTDGYIYQASQASLNQTPSSSSSYWTRVALQNTFTNTQQLVKINTATGAIMWSFNLGGSTSSFVGTSLSQSRIVNGYTAIITKLNSTDSTLYWINTLTGATVSSQQIYGVTSPSSQAYDGYTGSIVTLVSNYNSAESGAPTPSGSTPTTFGGNMVFYGNPPASVSPYFAPFVVGNTYTSKAQMVIPTGQPETGARNGPGQGKTRRSQEFAANLYNVQGISFGTDFTLGSAGGTLYPANFQTPGGTAYTALQLYSGVYWDKLEDIYSFTSQPTWQVTRPYPATVLSMEVFVSTQDR